MQKTRSDPNALALAIAVLACVVGSAAPQPNGTAVIRGTVTAAETGRPIRGATVRLTAPRGPHPATTTDAEGRFQFPDLAVGEYTVTAARAGYVPLTFGQKSPGGDPQRIRLAAGQRFDRADIVLSRGGVITGRVFDEFGDPIPEAFVQAFRTQYAQGVRRLSPVKGTASNDIGQFRLYGLQPGTYYVSGTVRSGETAPDLTPIRIAPGAEGFAQTFYPAGFSPAEARPLLVEAGQQIANVDFQLQPVRLVRISGRIVDSQGRPSTRMAVMLNSARPDGVVVGNPRFAQTDADGLFRLTGVPPGEYRIDARAVAELEAIGRTGGRVGTRQDGDAAEFASAPVTVAGEDIEGLVVMTSRGHTLSGRLVVEGGAIDGAALAKVSVGAYDAAAGASVSAVLLSASANVQPDLSFLVRGLAGTRVLRVQGLPDGWTLKAVRVDARDLTDAGVDIRGDVLDVEVVVVRAADVSGTIVDSRGQPIGDRTVLVFPDDEERWSGFMNRYVFSVRAAADGTFTIRAAPPGSYLAAVVDPIGESEWMAPENLARLRATATKFPLAEGEKKTLRLVTR